MSSTERAPEPTMEEILASIRRIISDDESNSAKRSAVPQSQDDDEALELSEGEAEDEADDKIINDIARVLSGGAAAPVEAAEEEDILDLTAELGGLEPVEEEVEAVELVAEAEAPAPEFLPEPQQLEPAPESEAAPAAPEPEVAADPAQASQPLSASEEAASALERAIAALRAGQLPTSPIFSYEPPPFATPAEPAPAPEPVAGPMAQAPEPVFAPEGEPELTLTEFEAEMVAQEPSILDVVVSEPEPERGWEPEVPSWAAREQPQPEPEYPAQRANGGNHQTYASGGEAGPKSLEDSVKDMLRPMLQRWLDENMTRVLTAALKDELRDNPARFQGD